MQTYLSSVAEKELKAVARSSPLTLFYGQIRNTQLVRNTQLLRSSARWTQRSPGPTEKCFSALRLLPPLYLHLNSLFKTLRAQAAITYNCSLAIISYLFILSIHWILEKFLWLSST